MSNIYTAMTLERYEQRKEASIILVGKYEPSSQERFISLSSSKDAITEMLIIGPKGGGKTQVMLIDAILSLQKLKKHKLRYCIVRQVNSAFLDIKDKIISILENDFKLVNKIDFVFLGSPKDFKFVFKGPKDKNGKLTGSELLLRAVSDYRDYNRLIHGQEYQRFYFDEISLYPNLEVYKLCMTCLRYSAKEKGLDVDEVPLLMRASSNPWELGLEAVWKYFLPENEKSYNKKYTTKMKIQGVEQVKTKMALYSSWEENYKLPASWLPGMVIALRDDKAKFNAFLKGIPDFSDASFFGEVWEYSKVVYPGSWVPPKAWSRNALMCYDDGTASPFAVLWYFRSDGSAFIDWKGEARIVPKNSIFFFYEYLGCIPEDEMVGQDLTHPEIAAKIKEINNGIITAKIGNKAQCGPADSAIFINDRGGKQGSVAKLFEKFNLFWKKSAKFNGSRRHDAQLFRAGLQATKNQSENYPHIYISDDCPYFIDQLPRLKRNKKDPEDVDNNAEKKIDHLYDAAKGAVSLIVNSKIIENY